MRNGQFLSLGRMATRCGLTGLMAIAIGLVPLTATPASAAVSCYGGRLWWNAGLADWEDNGITRIPSSTDQHDVVIVDYPSTPTFYYRASSRCRDINFDAAFMGPGTSVNVHVCFRPSSGSPYCNAWTGTIFSVEFQSPFPDSVAGYIAH
jgi:hypothetical protein